RVQLQPDATLPDRLTRLDEGPANVAVLDQALPVGDAAALRVADGGGRPRLRHRNDQVRVDWVLRGEPPPDGHPRRLHAAAADRGVGPGQVDVLEPAATRPGRGERPRADTALIDRDQFSWLDLPDRGRAHDVERRRLAGDDPATCQPAEYERAEPLRVAGGVERPLIHEHEREGALDAR